MHSKDLLPEESEKIVYFVRHGQSADNVSPVFQSPDSPLNERGQAQAASVAGRVANLSFEALISSPFQRAKETVEAIEKATGKKAEFSPLFVERIKPTSINGKMYEDAAAHDTYERWKKSLYASGDRVEDGENFDDLVTRAEAALAFLADRPEKAMVVVTHGFFLRTMVARVLLGDLLSGKAHHRIQKAAFMENTGISVLRYRKVFDATPSWRLWIYNDHAHLG